MRSILVPLALVSLLPAAPGAPASTPAVRGGLIPSAPADEAIVYGSTAGGRRELRLVLAGTGQDRGSMTPPGVRDVEPAWSPDGTNIAFARKPSGSATHSVHVVLAEGGGTSRVTSGGSDDRQPAWSPDGTTLAFARADPIRGSSRILSVRKNGSGLTGITGKGSSSRMDASPAWSPDGQDVAFVRAERGLSRLSVIGADGAGRVEIAPVPDCADANPSWSDEGLLFERSCGGEPPDLWLVEQVVGGWTDPVNLTGTPTTAEFDADWAPDRSAIVFSTHPVGEGDANLAVMEPVPGTPVPLVAATTSDLGADWHHFSRPNGRACDLVGRTTADTIAPSPSAQVICALDGDDVIDGGPGNDVLRGGGGVDAASFTSGSTVTADLSTGTATSGGATDTLIGMEDLTGSSQGDHLTGDGRANVLTGGPGNDTMAGGGGQDTASYDAAASAVQADLGAGTATGTAIGTDALSEIERLLGSSQGDQLTGDGGPNTLTGGPGNDVLAGAGGSDMASYARATAGVTVDLSNIASQDTEGAGSDTLSSIESLGGSGHDDQLTGNGAPNRLDGGSGNDTLEGLDGDDLLIGGKDDDLLGGGDDDDEVRGDDGRDDLTGGSGDDELSGGSAPDTLSGGSGDDTLSGGGGDDDMEGGSGRDRLNADSGNDRAEGGDGADRLSGSSGEDVLLGDAGGDVLSGGDGQDRLTGGSGGDRFSGGAGNDRLSARDGTRDRVNGGSGEDRGSIDRRRDAVASVESARRSRRFRSRSTKVAPGIVLRKIRDRRGPRRIFVLSVAPGGGRATDTALARDVLKGFERTTSMAKRNGAVAAVNGDFGLPSGRPAHHFSMDGDLKQTSEAHGYHFAMSVDAARAFMGHRGVALDSVITTRDERWDVARWNDGRPGTGEIAGVAATSGGLEAPPAHACSARLSPVQAQGMRWNDDGDGVESDHTVQEVSCGSQGLSLQGGIVLSARAFSEEGAFIRGLAFGNALTLSWSMGWPGVLDALGGYPQLIRAGKVMVGSCKASLCRRHPRTGVGMRPDGTVMLVVVDGRRKRWSRGMTLKQFARQFERLGAVSALNLDGGGSSTMWIRGQGIVNRPSDRRERSVSSALLVLTGPDGGEPAMAAAGGNGQQAPPPPEAAIDHLTGSQAVADPGSTGGLLEALAEGIFDPPQALTGELRQALVRFRASLGG